MNIELSPAQFDFVLDVMRRGAEDFHYMAGFPDNGVTAEDVREFDEAYESAIKAMTAPHGARVTGVVGEDGEVHCPECDNTEFGYLENCVDYRTPGDQNPKAKTVTIIWHADGTADSGDCNPGLFCDDWRAGGCGRPIELPEGWEIDYQ